MKFSKYSLVAAVMLSLASQSQATLKNDKITLKGNMVLKLNEKPKPVDNITDAFANGVFYGRLRTNMFKWNWKKDSYPTNPNYPYKKGKLMDNKAMGIGGSFVYKTAPLYGISMTAGLYTSQNPAWFREDASNVGYVKAGKDTYSRYDTTSTGNYGMTVLGQAYLQYDIYKTSIIAGRQLFESVFTKSNDTKMIPNTFDGVTATIKDIPKTTIQLAYLDKQKLRDHTKAHDVIAFAGSNAYKPASYKWTQNDDAAVNKNLTVDLIGKNNDLLIATVTNKSIKNLKLNVSYAMVPDVISNLTLEAHYAIPIVDDWKVVPGVRYMKQFDNLSATKHYIAYTKTGGVANLGTNQAGYTDPRSLNSNLIAARVDIKNDAFLARFGYSKIADKADIVAPWRGFPTGGFTRAMAQYNWFANTKTYMARVGYDFGKADILEGFSIMVRYAIQDTDDKKSGVAGDSKIIHVDLRQNIGKNLEAKLRFGLARYDDNIGYFKDGKYILKPDLSYREYRFELNYFF